jgi:hypothetical protein
MTASKKYFSVGPSVVGTPADGRRTDSEFHGPPMEAPGHSAVGDSAAAPLVRTLLRPRSPSAISGLVVPVVVDPVDRVLGGRPLSHVGQERLERVQPAVAHLDSASAVVFPTGAARVGAPILCAGPHPVFCTQTVSGRVSVRRCSRAPEFAPKATATPNTSAPQRVCVDDLLNPTVTDDRAPNTDSAVRFGALAQHSKTSELRASGRHFLEPRHTLIVAGRGGVTT